ncbi:MAG: class I SAM-dependent methyltransferase [Burkholderiales bacterium]|nr:MAG: class I SAM-dependent methyltransferase [Burkholderiales bacterium]
MNDTSELFSYSGDELESFETAVNWKAYWSAQIAPYIGQDVLELGAGLGATARTLAGHPVRRWLGLEPDPAMCDVVRQRTRTMPFPAGYEIRCGTSETLDSAELFDTVLYIDVLEHIEDDRGELDRVAALLRPGGHVVVVAPAHQWLYTDFDRKIGHFRRYNAAMLKAIVPAGLTVCRMRYLDSVGMLASLGNKLVLRSDSPKASQIRLWDSVMVRLSRWIDPLAGYQLGKSIVCVLSKPAAS